MAENDPLAGILDEDEEKDLEDELKAQMGEDYERILDEDGRPMSYLAWPEDLREQAQAVVRDGPWLREWAGTEEMYNKLTSPGETGAKEVFEEIDVRARQFLKKQGTREPTREEIETVRADLLKSLTGLTLVEGTPVQRDADSYIGQFRREDFDLSLIHI